MPDIKEILLQKNLINCFNRDFLEQSKIFKEIEDIISVRKDFVSIWKNKKYPWMYYLIDLINLGFQRFYGIQMHLERYYCENLTTFYDYDLIYYLLSTDYINIYKNAFKNSLWFRRKNRRIQSVIIKNFFKKIGEVPVDRGYPPNYNLNWRKIFIPFIFYKRKKRLKKMPPDFISNVWCKIFFENWDKIKIDNKDIFNKSEIDKKIFNYKPSSYNEDFNHLLSIAIWLSK